MPLLKRRHLCAAKIEVTPGTAETLAAADGAMNVFDINIQADIPMTDRVSQSVLSRLPSVPGARAGKISLMVELANSGSGTVPLWASTFLAACGMKNTAGVYKPTSNTDEMVSLTIGVYERGPTGNVLLKRLAGCMGTFTIDGTSGVVVPIRFEFTGVWQPPTDVAAIAPDYPAVIPPRLASSTFTVGGAAKLISKLSIASNNTIKLAEDITHVSGYSRALITDRNFGGSFDPEAALVATDDVFGAWIAGTEAALSFTVGTGTNGVVTVAAPKLQYRNVQEADRELLVVHNAEFNCNKSADAGDDEISVTFS